MRALELRAAALAAVLLAASARGAQAGPALQASPSGWVAPSA